MRRQVITQKSRWRSLKFSQQVFFSYKRSLFPKIDNWSTKSVSLGFLFPQAIAFSQNR
ncbi:MAG: hypothetical protein AB4368_05705 [Xenococcaceae cyanobacterium]